MPDLSSAFAVQTINEKSKFIVITLNIKNMSYLILTFSNITYKKYVENEIFSGSKRPREITLSFSSVRPSVITVS